MTTSTTTTYVTTIRSSTIIIASHPLQSTLTALPTPLDTLPWVVLENICGYLASLPDDRQSLACFSLTSSACAFAAQKCRLEYVRLHIRSDRKLLQDVRVLERALSSPGDTTLGFVRQIKLTGFMRFLTNQCGGYADENLVPREHETSNYGGCGLDILDDSDANHRDARVIPPVPIGKDVSRPYHSLDNSPDAKKRIEDAWAPLASFISRLRSLKHLVWVCDDQIPMSLLRSLEHNSPMPRLHVHTFHLRSGSRDARCEERGLFPAEYALMTSPCLHSIIVRVGSTDTYYDTRFNDIAIKRMVRGLAPNLKSVLWWSRSNTQSNISFWGENSSSYSEARDPLIVKESDVSNWEGEWPEWRESRGQGASSSRGHLETLAYDGDSIESWADRTDLNELQTLKPVDLVTLLPMESLVRVASFIGFRSLRSLEIWFGSEDGVDEQATLLMQNLPSLEVIRLGGFLTEETLHAMLKHHGSTLRRLSFMPARSLQTQRQPMVFSPDHMKAIKSKAPRLERLEIQMPRTTGDHREVEIYRMLGQMPRLSHVSLIFDCLTPNPVTIIEVQGEDRIMLIDPTSIRSALINSAIDSKLAKSIFKVMLSQGSGIKSLKLQIFKPEDLGYGQFDGEVQTLLEKVGRDWSCEASGNDIRVREIKNIEPLGLKGFDPYNEYHVNDIPGLMEVWEEIWPDGVYGLWWCSFPLAE